MGNLLYLIAVILVRMGDRLCGLSRRRPHSYIIGDRYYCCVVESDQER